MPSEEFRELIKNNNSFRDILSYWGLENKGGNNRTLHKRIQEEEINVDHIYHYYKSREIHRKSALPLDQVMVKGSKYCRGRLKKRLLQEGFLKNQCSLCKLGPKWEGKKLVLVLDHINGESDDHRLVNLRLLCPNCNSQQKTFAGRKLRKIRNCENCGKKISRTHGLCRKCSSIKNSINRRVVKNRPTKQMLMEDVRKMGYCATGRKHGVSDNTIRKWLRFAGEQ